MRISALFLGAALFAVPAFAVADSPQQFLRAAMQGDNAEIIMGRLAQDRAVSPGVRDYGRTLERDHQNARNEAVSVARSFGVRPDRNISREARQDRNRLQRLSGREFDREFIRTMVEDHRQDIAAFRDESRERHGAVSQLARNQLPTLQKHLDIALGLQDRLDRMVDYGHREYRDRNRYPYGR